MTPSVYSSPPPLRARSSPTPAPASPACRCARTPSGVSASISALITVGGAPMVPDSPMPLTPSGLVLHGTSSSVALDVRHRVGARHAVVHEAAGQQLPGLAVVDLVLDQRLADALHHAAVDLAAHDHRIEHAAEIVDHEVAVDHDLAGLRIDLELADMRAVRMARRRWRCSCRSPRGRRRTSRSAGPSARRTPWRRRRAGSPCRCRRRGYVPVLELDVGGVRLHHARRPSACPSR